MVFVISLMFIALFFSIQKNISAASTCGNNVIGCEEDPYNECDFNEDACMAQYNTWELSYGDSTSGCWSGKCCGDDFPEYYKYRLCDNSYACSTSTSDRACCDASTDCCHSGCYSSQSHSHDVDGDGDPELCYDGRWYDCYNNDDCSSGQYCSSNNCLSCQCTSGTCCDGCFFKTSGTLCRADAGDCDVTDYCTGSSSLCQDSKESNGTACGSYHSSSCDTHTTSSCDGSHKKYTCSSGACNGTSITYDYDPACYGVDCGTCCSCIGSAYPQYDGTQDNNCTAGSWTAYGDCQEKQVGNGNCSALDVCDTERITGM